MENIWLVLIDIWNYLRQYFDIGYMLLLFLSGKMILKSPPLNRVLNKTGKQYTIIILGLVYGVLFLHFNTTGMAIMEQMKYILVLGISFSATILFHDGVWEIGHDLLKKWRNKA